MRPRCWIDMEVPGSINAAGLVEVIALTGIEVVCSMRGCGVDRSGEVANRGIVFRIAQSPKYCVQEMDA